MFAEIIVVLVIGILIGIITGLSQSDSEQKS
jgi:hypothetical protein